MTKKPPLAGALRPLFMEMIGDESTKRDLEKYDFDPELYRRSCAKGDLDAIRQFSKNLTDNLAKLREEHNRAQKGSERIGFHVPHIFGDLACRMLQKCQENSVAPPRELCKFFETIFNIESRGKSKSGKSYERALAAYNLANYPEINKSQLAKGLGIARTTIFSWLREADFKGQIEAQKKILRPGSK